MLTLSLILTLGCSTEEIAEEAPPPTWNADILPLVEEHCVACHVDGGVAPMALDTYEALEATSPSGDRPVWDTLLPYIDAQIMPPSGAMAECIAYAGDHADVVDEGERTLLVQWIDAGRPRGDGPEVHYTPPASPADDLPAPDHLVRRPEAYTPQFNGSGNDYACFMIPSGFDETKWISKITPAIDNKRIVHHMLLFRAEDNGSEWCRGEEMTSDLIAGWAPGQDGWFLPEGVAFRMDPGDVFALQIHYDATQEDGKGDQSGMNLYFTDTAEHEAGVLWTGSVSGGADDPGGLGFKIPANDPAYQVEGSCTITPLMGEISIFGEQMDCATAEENLDLRRRWGVLFQNGALFSTLTVAENVQVPIREFYKTIDEKLLGEIATFKIVMSGLKAEDAPKYPSELSGGMRKRAALARSLALDPVLLFLDEPTAGLDPIGAAAFDNLILELKEALGLTIFLITHDLDTLHTICDRVAVLADRKVIASGTIEELLALDHPWIQEYFNGPRGRAAMAATG